MKMNDSLRASSMFLAGSQHPMLYSCLLKNSGHRILSDNVSHLARSWIRDISLCIDNATT
ncbi:hypothetical protein M422DRAFT_24913 [Sphaerobolus stellatus SS14]|nr:hypothetical protein M422DRAFT_24908 [Sphaerobolus stellatus SS14]KIJ55073.1 hypothetical protein M422DRAFT_24913 [Sphaerobolus stellatus SS14]